MHHAFVNAESELDQFALRLPLRFRFSWAGIRFEALGELAAGGGALVRLVADLGPVPFTGEAAAVRERLLSLSHWREKQRATRFVIAANQRLHLLCQGAAPPPLSAPGLFATAARLVMEAMPALELAQATRAEQVN